MKIVVICPETEDPREHGVLADLLDAGLDRYHVRRPDWSCEKLAAWLEKVAPAHRSRLALHQHHDLAAQFGCGLHWKDTPEANAAVGTPAALAAPYRSRSCHDLAAVEASLGRFDSIFYGPIFPSLSKPSHRPTGEVEAVAERVRNRTEAEKRTAVIALGGITPTNAQRCARRGFDGIAVVGAIWFAVNPTRAFLELQASISPDAA